MNTPAVIAGRARDLLKPPLSLFGQRERESLLRVFDDCAARGGFENESVAEFEQRFAAKLGVRNAVAVASGTSALQLSLQAHGIGPGDEVLISPYTFVAPAHAILHAGARPVFADIEMETLCISPQAIASKMTPAVKAILVVQIGGKPAKMDEITRIAAEHGLIVIEDAAQAHGATFQGRYVGTLGAAGAFSFSPKLMTSFRGGALVTNDDRIAETCRQLRFHGLPGAKRSATYQRQLDVKGVDHFVHYRAGYSLAMTSLQAALLLPQIDTLDERARQRHDNGVYLARGLATIPGLSPVTGEANGNSNFYMLEVLFDPEQFGGLSRDQFVTALSWEGVPVSPTYATQSLAYHSPSLAQYVDGPCRAAESMIERLTIFGHPLQSLVLQADRSVLDEIVARVRLVAENASWIAEHYALARAS